MPCGRFRFRKNGHLRTQFSRYVIQDTFGQFKRSREDIASFVNDLGEHRPRKNLDRKDLLHGVYSGSPTSEIIDSPYGVWGSLGSIGQKTTEPE